MKQIDVKRSTVVLDPDRTHVLARPFRLMDDHRSVKIAARVMALPERDVHALLEGVRAEFGDRQLKIDEFLRRRYDEVSPYLLNGQRLSEDRKLLLGGYFTHEYSLFRSKPLRCSIPRWCRTRISPAFRPARCVSC